MFKPLLPLKALLLLQTFLFVLKLNALKHGPAKLILNAQKLFVHNRRHDRTDYHQNTIESPRKLDPTECKHAIRHLKGINNPQLLIIATHIFRRYSKATPP